MVWCMGGYMGGLMGGSCQITKKLINLDLIEIIQFSLKIYDLWRHTDLWVGVWFFWWMGGLMGGLMDGFMSND